jgi:hypothetical protein
MISRPSNEYKIIQGINKDKIVIKIKTRTNLKNKKKNPHNTYKQYIRMRLFGKRPSQALV